jgi:hypothetical protein
MGQELANLHLASQFALPAVHAHLAARSADWLQDAASVMTRVTTEDFQDYGRRSASRGSP